MAVNSTSSTAMAPMTSFARRERVGTDTGGRMATSGLLQMVVRRQPRSNTVNAPPRFGFPSGGPAPAPAPASRARLGGPAGAEVVEGGQGVVQRPDAGRRDRRNAGREQLGAVLGRDQEQVRADVLRRQDLERDATDGTDGAPLVDRPGAGDDVPAREVLATGQLHDAQGEHEAGRRAA